MFKSFHNFLRRILDIENIYHHFYISIFQRNKKYVLVDMGANKGLFAKEFLRRCSISKAVLIEPDPSLAKDLRSDFPEKNIYILNAAIGPEVSESVPFYLSKNQEASSLNKELVKGHGLVDEGSQVNVRMTTLKEVCSLFDLTKIDLLKIDIEGAEYDLLENLSKEDFKKIDQISVEFHDFIDPELRERTEKCIKKIRSHGYLFIYAGTTYLYGSPYENCLFFKKRVALIGLIFRLLRVPKAFALRIFVACKQKVDR